MRRASGLGWFEETVKAGLIATGVDKDRQKGTWGTAGNGRNRVALDQSRDREYSDEGYGKPLGEWVDMGIAFKPSDLKGRR